MMMPERESSPEPAAKAGENDVERRLRALGSSCAVPAAAVLVTSGVVGWKAVGASAADWMNSAPGGSFLAAVCGMLLVLLASAAYGRILRRQADLEAEEAADLEGAGEARDVEAVVGEGGAMPSAAAAAAAAVAAAAEAAAEPAAVAAAPAAAAPAAASPEAAAALARLRAFSWATGTCFGMLAVAAVLGALAADGGKAPLLGVVVCVAVVFAMRARWPTRGAFESAFPATGQDGGENLAGGRR
ncbi:MAG TPA: hypothetical protein VKY89_23985 [Thermoanaerobaculia bacterium]|nr:hypothetical protein [Thermoanaerobaculia bacterium]